MTKWDYRMLLVSRTGTKEDFSYTWTYTPWEIAGTAKQSLQEGLQELGRQGWELVGVLPTDFWTEGGRQANASHGTRAISFTLLLKRPLEDQV